MECHCKPRTPGGMPSINSSDPLVPTQGGQPFPRNSFDLNAERGNSDFDVRQRLAINYVWDLPVGRGHAHLSETVLGRSWRGGRSRGSRHSLWDYRSMF